LILDAHTHVFPDEVCLHRGNHFAGEPAFRLLYDSPGSRLVTDRELTAAMDKEGVDAAVILGFPWRQERLWRLHNDCMLEAARRNPQRLIPFCSANPLEPAAASEIERCLNAGCRGVGELAWYSEDPGNDLIAPLSPIAELCLHFKAPMLIHANDPVGAPYPGKTAVDLPALYELIKNFPGVDFILAHWGGGLPFYGLLKKEAPEVFKRVYFDTAASPYLYRPEIYRLAAEMVGPDKILFGSDYPLISPGRYFSEMKGARLPEGWRNQILGGNLARLLGIGREQP
jgi:predicted TIM-barrel fold metal-dependent hydrolase